ncbi:MAG: hypothetical protein V4439_01645 [Patescibacteria group bacterium]
MAKAHGKYVVYYALVNNKKVFIATNICPVFSDDYDEFEIGIDSIKDKLFKSLLFKEGKFKELERTEDSLKIEVTLKFYDGSEAKSELLIEMADEEELSKIQNS